MDLEKLVSAMIPILMAAWKLLTNSELMKAVFKSHKLTPEQREIITRMREAAVKEFDSLAPKDEE